LTVWRKGGARDLPVTVAAIDDASVASKSVQDQQDRKPAPSTENLLGLAVANLPQRQKSQLQTNGNVYITALNQATAMSGLRRGDIILRVNDTDIQNVAQFQKVALELDRKKTIVFLVQRNDLIFFVPLKPAG
jgi:serine protease Do